MNQNYNSPSPRRVNERLRRRRRRTAAIVIFLLAAVLVSLLAVYVGLLLRNRPDTPDSDSQTTLAPTVTDGAPADTTAPDDTTVTPETTAVPETTAAPVITYTTINMSRDAITQGNLVLVNASFPYTFPANEKHLTTIYGNKSRGYQIGSAQDKLDTDALAAWSKAADAFLAETGDGSLLLTNNGGYRSREAQETLYQKRVASVGEAEAAKYVALPGNSEHHTGLAFDLAVYRDGKTYTLGSDEIYNWVPQNLPRYGFVLRYPADKVNVTGISYEEWHFRYVGIPHAVYMTENNLCLEEYLNTLRAYHADGQHLTVTSDGVEYEIWYVPVAEGDVTPIAVPNGVTYSISGNNMDGFVVTLTRPGE